MAIRIIVFGASGRVGTCLVEAVIADPGLELAGAIVSPRSTRLGRPVGNGVLEYRTIDPAMNARCDAIIDFSTPEASMELQRGLGAKPLPVVVGTTGFSPRQHAALAAASQHRAILLGANFALAGATAAFTVKTLAAYVQGALAATRWLVERRPGAGLFTPGDMLPPAAPRGGAGGRR